MNRDASTPPGPMPNIPLTQGASLSAGLQRSRRTLPELRPIPSRMRVGVVDDEPTVLEVLARMLSTENFELVVASSGPEMMEKLRPGTGELDLLITDFAMPEMHGRELAQRVRQRCPTAKVLYQTGCADLLFEDRSELEDGAAFVEKPVSVRALREAARLALFGVLNPV